MDTIESSSPRSFRMPAEWSPHLACLILYPHNPYVFRSQCKPAQEQVIMLAQAIARHGKEEVILFCKSDQEAALLQKELKDESRIFVMVCPSDDTWARDTGPTFVFESGYCNRLVGLDWDFNAYGGPEHGCYWPCDLDRAVASNMCRSLSLKYKSFQFDSHNVPLVLEGGSIHTDGEGTLLTTKECLLNPNRNPAMSMEEIETVVLNSLGCTKAIWLPLGLTADDDTNGHIDNFACFVRPGCVVLSWCDDKDVDPENYKRCRQALAVLEQEVDAKGRTMAIHKLHLPPPMYYTEEEVQTLAKYSDTAERTVGERLAASYVNFYIANEAVVVPQFGFQEYDARAIETLQELFPNRTVVGIASREILLGGGNIHCFTQQVPMPKERNETQAS